MNAMTQVALVNIVLLAVAGYAVITATRLGDRGFMLAKSDEELAERCFRNRSIALVIAALLLAISMYYAYTRFDQILIHVGVRS